MVFLVRAFWKEDFEKEKYDGRVEDSYQVTVNLLAYPLHHSHMHWMYAYVQNLRMTYVHAQREQIWLVYADMRCSWARKWPMLLVVSWAEFLSAVKLPLVWCVFFVDAWASLRWVEL